MHVQPFSWEDPLEKGMVTHCSTFAWRTPWTEEPGRATVNGVTKSQTRLSTHAHIHLRNHKAAVHFNTQENGNREGAAIEFGGAVVL